MHSLRKLYLLYYSNDEVLIASEKCEKNGSEEVYLPE